MSYQITTTMKLQSTLGISYQDKRDPRPRFVGKSLVEAISYIESQTDTYQSITSILNQCIVQGGKGLLITWSDEIKQEIVDFLASNLGGIKKTNNRLRSYLEWKLDNPRNATFKQLKGWSLESPKCQVELMMHGYITVIDGKLTAITGYGKVEPFTKSDWDSGRKSFLDSLKSYKSKYKKTKKYIRV